VRLRLWAFEARHRLFQCNSITSSARERVLREIRRRTRVVVPK
jgi:hypothetical protein